MKLLKVAFAFALLVAVFTIGVSATKATAAQDSAGLEVYEKVPVQGLDYQSNVPAFQGEEKTLADSLESASSTVLDPTLKDLLSEAAVVIKNRPKEGAGLADWASWAVALIGLIGGIVGYVLGKVRKKPTPSD